VGELNILFVVGLTIPSGIGVD